MVAGSNAERRGSMSYLRCRGICPRMSSGRRPVSMAIWVAAWTSAGCKVSRLAHSTVMISGGRSRPGSPRTGPAGMSVAPITKSACDEDGCRILNGWAGWLPHGGSKPQVGPVSRCSGRTAGSPLHTRSAGRGWRDSSRAAWSAPRSEGSPVRTCVISGTLAPTSR